MSTVLEAGKSTEPEKPLAMSLPGQPEQTTAPTAATLRSGPPCLPPTAPFDVEQRAWINGYLAGLFCFQPRPAVAPPGDAPEQLQLATAKATITIAWGSQTGTSENLAKKVRKHFKTKGHKVNLRDLADYTLNDLRTETCLLLITSTFGEGDPPDNAAAFYHAVHEANAPRLEKLRFSVLALGDTNYEQFCKTGIDFDERFQALGAERLFPRQDCDVDFDKPFATWLNGVDKALNEDAPQTDLELAEEPEAELSSDAEYSRKNPFPAAMLENRALNGEGSAKDTRHITFSLAGSGITYEPGDALGVMPVNCSSYVDAILQAMNADGEESVATPEGDVSFRHALSCIYEVRNLTLTFLKKFAELASSHELDELLTPDRKAELNRWISEREILDVIMTFPGVVETPAQFLGLLKKLQPRLYSIASSQRAHPDEVHLTVGVVRYNSLDRERKGVCSTFLAERCPESLRSGVFVHHNKNFRLPENPATPVIMVGPGTGIAPFRAFLQERQAQGIATRNWLFFGDQHEKCDFLYRNEAIAWLKDGTLTHLNTAFSRDQEKKIYVQDRMRSAASELFAWLEDGAHFYVCGDASRMAKDVDAALLDVIQRAGSLSPEAARAYVDNLRKAKRYQRDVY